MRQQIDLNGTWDLVFDSQEMGARLDWIADSWPAAESESADVPSVWNISHPDKQGVGYYRRTFEIPADWRQQTVRLHIDGACYRLEAWLNGAYVGNHEGAYTPFWFDVTAAARLSERNVCVFRVTSLSRLRAIDGMELKEMPVAKQSWHYAEGGLWGNVWLEAVPVLCCDSIGVEPHLHDESASIEVTLHNRTFDQQTADLSLTITDPYGTSVFEWGETVSAPPGVSNYLFFARLPNAMAWSCEAPNLYRTEFALTSDGVETDRLVSNFGMRDFTVSNGQYLLNGTPIFVKGVLLQPNYPVGLLAPLDRGMIETEVREAMDAGFNMIRVHLRPAIPELLDLTDRLGILVYAETSLAWIKDSPRVLDHGRRELTNQIQRDKNHPSIVVWGIFNEHRGPSARYSDALIRTARALDPTRVLIDNSGGSLAIDQDFGWIDRATAVPERSSTRQPIQDVHIYIGAPVSKGALSWLRAIGEREYPVDLAEMGYGAPALFEEWQRELRDFPGKVFVSELGCGGMSDLDDVVAAFGDSLEPLDAREYVAYRSSLHDGFRDRGLDRFFGSIKELVTQAQQQQALGNRRQTEALLTNPRISGYIVTQLNDLSCEFHAGLLDIWRRPKPVIEEYKRLQADRVLILNTSAAAVSAGESYCVEVNVVDRNPSAQSTRVSISISDQEGREVCAEDQTVQSGAGIKRVGSLTVPTREPGGEHRILATLHGNGDCRAEEKVLVLHQVDSDETGLLASHGAAIVESPGELDSSQWVDLLNEVESGATAMLGALKPVDRGAICMLRARGLPIELHMGFGNWLGCYHWIGDSSLFDGLPSSQLAGEVYAEVIPRYVLGGLGGEVLAGTLTNTHTRVESPNMLWFSDVEVVQLGHGQLIFCQYRIFETARDSPVAARMRSNLRRLAHELDSVPA